MKPEVIFELVSDGIAFVGPTGAARFANGAARELLGAQLDTLYVHTAMQALLAQVRAGRTALPAKLAIELAAGGQELPLELTVLDWKAGGGFIFVIKRAAASGPSSSLDVAGALELVRQEVYAPLVAALETARAAAPETIPTAVVERAERTVELFDVFKLEEVVDDARVELRAALDAAWTRLQPIAGARLVNVALRGFERDLPPVYGSEKLLHRAVAELLHNAITHSRAGKSAEDMSLVEIDASVDGDWLVLRIANRGLGFVNRMSGRTFLPFARPAGKPPASGLGIGLALVQRVAELHGGFLEVDAETPELVAATLRLKTGAPPISLKAAANAQAERYARDLARLLARRAKREAAADAAALERLGGEQAAAAD